MYVCTNRTVCVLEGVPPILEYTHTCVHMNVMYVRLIVTRHTYVFFFKKNIKKMFSILKKKSNTRYTAAVLR